MDATPPGGGFFGGASLITILQSIQQTLGVLNTTIAKTFPQATGTSSSATGGAATLPANPTGFIQVYVPSLNATVKVPYYT